MKDAVFNNMIVQLYHVDARQLPIQDESIDCVVTSPPYWGLRNYDLDNGIGLEPTIEEWVTNIVLVFREVWRVLKPTGTVWMNLGDGYAQGGKLGSMDADSEWQKNQVRAKDKNYNVRGWGAGKHRNQGASGRASGTAASKDKNNVQSNHAETDSPLWHDKKYPRSFRSTRYTNQPTSNTYIPELKTKDLIGMPWRAAFALQADGWYLRSDIIWSKLNPMPESVTDRPTKAHEYIFLLTKQAKYYYDADAIRESSSNAVVSDNRNKRTVWEIPTQPYPDAHFATYPEKLVEPCILAGCPPDGVALDPFVGSGTTLAVAQRLGRKGVGTDLNKDYLTLAEQRLRSVTLPMDLS